MIVMRVYSDSRLFQSTFWNKVTTTSNKSFKKKNEYKQLAETGKDSRCGERGIIQIEIQTSSTTQKRVY